MATVETNKLTETREEFESRYSKGNKNMFGRSQIALPCNCGDDGGSTHWAAVTNDAKAVATHLEIYTPDEFKNGPDAVLLPCPFCGGDPDLEDSRTIWIVRCKCGASVLGQRSPEPKKDYGPEYWNYFRKSAIDAWNRRIGKS